MRHRLVILLSLAALVAVASAAGAQPTAPAAPAVAPSAAGSALPPPPYESAVRPACEAELARDARWSAELERTYIDRFHLAQARVATNNNRHVVLAYGALWILTVGFLALMYLRQRKLDAEIRRLEADLAKATSAP